MSSFRDARQLGISEVGQVHQRDKQSLANAPFAQDAHDSEHYVQICSKVGNVRLARSGDCPGLTLKAFRAIWFVPESGQEDAMSCSQASQTKNSRDTGTDGISVSTMGGETFRPRPAVTTD